MSERIARLRIELQDLETRIWRRIDMPLSATLEALHEAIQMTMGWTFSHLWEFDLDGRCYGDPEIEYPAFVDGARRCPPEDVGGVDGFMDFLEAVLDPGHEEHRDMVRWYGGPFDPSGLDEERARFGMENMARRRRGPLASHRSGSRRAKR